MATRSMARDWSRLGFDGLKGFVGSLGLMCVELRRWIGERILTQSAI